jgi:hypothetical protein
MITVGVELRGGLVVVVVVVVVEVEVEGICGSEGG